MSVCIIIPTCNRFNELQKTLSALGQQTVMPDRTIVIDDGSPQDVLLRIQNLIASSRPPIELIKCSPKKGPSAARNTGIKHAREEYILFINDDTIPCGTTFLEQHLAFAASHPNCGILGRLQWSPETPNQLLFGRWTRRLSFDVGYEHMQKADNLEYHKFCTANVMVPRRFLKDCLFDEGFPFAAYEDIELGFRLFQAGMNLRYNPDACVYHYHHYTPEKVIDRQIKAGCALAHLLRIHPELTAWHRPKISPLGSCLLSLFVKSPLIRFCSQDLQLFLRQLAGKYEAFWAAFRSELKSCHKKTST